jgi:hypothetical protein
MANEVADQAMEDPQMMVALVEGLSEPHNVVQGRAIHSLERISRAHPEMLRDLVPQLATLALHNKVPIVKWHIPMIFANMALSETDVETVYSTPPIIGGWQRLRKDFGESKHNHSGKKEQGEGQRRHR